MALEDLSSSNSSTNIRRNQGMMYDSPDGYSGPVENNNNLLQQRYNIISQQTIGPDFNPQNEEIKDLLINAKINAKFNAEKRKFNTVKLYSGEYKEAKNNLNQIKEKVKN